MCACMFLFKSSDITNASIARDGNFLFFIFKFIIIFSLKKPWLLWFFFYFLTALWSTHESRFNARTTIMWDNFINRNSYYGGNSYLTTETFIQNNLLRGTWLKRAIIILWNSSCERMNDKKKNVKGSDNALTFI